MISYLAKFDLKKLQNALNWKLLLFLLLFLNVKLAIKIPAIVIIYLLQADFKFKFSFRDSRLPLFYPLIIVLALAGFVINKSYLNHNYILVLLTGTGFWVLCILAIHQIKLSVDNSETSILHRTILVFFVINAVISLLNISVIIGEIHEFNPYTYQGQYQKYFLGTGDYIKGLTFDTSTTNAVLNAFGVVYFLTRSNGIMTLVCMAVLLLTCSNFTNIILIIVLLVLFIVKSTRDQKSLIAICVVLFVVFMAKISPQNNAYVVKTFNYMLHRPNPPEVTQAVQKVRITERPDNSLTFEEKREKIALLYLDSLKRLYPDKIQQEAALINPAIFKPAADGRIFIPKADINTAPYQSLIKTPEEELNLVKFIDTHKAVLPLSGKPFHWVPTPGKVTSMLQTVNFYKAHPGKIVAGDGMGNFSSKLAFKVSAIGTSGGFPAKYAYINNDFLINHLDLYLNFFSKRAGYHTLTNSPFSVYDQLFAEYGVLGLVLFLACYLGFFLKKWRMLTYGLPILVVMCAVFFVDYWFEQLSVIVFFELLLLLDMKESSANLKPIYA
jgi:hypothetical protein